MIERHVSRRRTLAAAAALPLFAGCGLPTDPELRFEGISTVNAAEGWRLELTVVSVSRDIPESEATFQDVQVLAYDPDGAPVGRATVGRIEKLARRSVDFECDEFPSIVTIDAARSPCDTDIVLPVVCYDGKSERDERWQYHERTCEEGLPPTCENLATPPSRAERSPTTANSTRTSE